MFGGLVAALRPVLAIVIVGGAAVVMVAPAVDMASQRAAESRAATSGQAPLRNQPQTTPQPKEEDPSADPTEPPRRDFETLLRECLDSRDPDSDECAVAALESGMSYEDFRAKIVSKLEPKPTKEPKPEPTNKAQPVVSTAKKPEPAKNNFDTLLKQCLETRDENSDACIRAGEASGLSAADWSAKIRGKLGGARQSDFATYFEKCLATRDINSDHCIRAEELSGLSLADFEAKFNAKLAAKDGTDFWAWFEKCLGTRDVRSDACVRARELIGFNDAGFQAKFERYLAERDAKSGKASAAPKPTTTTFDTLLKACGETHEKNSDACLRALVMSGLQPAEFWAKVEAKFGPFH